MTCYIHHVPGRLRVKSPAFKNRDGNAEAAKALIEAVDGVTGAETNSRTGSVTIYYDHGRVKPPHLLGVFVANEYIDLRAPLSFHGHAVTEGGDKARSHPTLVDGLAERVSKVLVDLALEKVLPRAAMILFGALA